MYWEIVNIIFAILITIGAGAFAIGSSIIVAESKERDRIRKEK